MSDLIEKAIELQDEIETFYYENNKSATDFGLDERAGNIAMLDGHLIAPTEGRLDYYGGFEYVKSEDRFSVGAYTIYLNTSSRVEGAIDHFENA